METGESSAETATLTVQVQFAYSTLGLCLAWATRAHIQARGRCRALMAHSMHQNVLLKYYYPKTAGALPHSMPPKCTVKVPRTQKNPKGPKNRGLMGHFMFDNV